MVNIEADNLASHLKPGAWFQLGELGTNSYSNEKDKPIPEDWPPKVALDKGAQALEMFGRVVPTAEWMEKLLTDAGFVDVKVSCRLPCVIRRGILLVSAEAVQTERAQFVLMVASGQDHGCGAVAGHGRRSPSPRLP